MTLQNEIMKALEEEKCLDPLTKNWSYQATSRIAAEVAKKYIEKAWKDRIIIFMESENDDGFKSDDARMEAWLKENGVI